MENSKKQLVKIHADGIQSHYGYVVDGDEQAAVVKVACRSDWMDCLEAPHCVLLGRSFLVEVSA